MVNHFLDSECAQEYGGLCIINSVPITGCDLDCAGSDNLQSCPEQCQIPYEVIGNYGDFGCTYYSPSMSPRTYNSRDQILREEVFNDNRGSVSSEDNLRISKTDNLETTLQDTLPSTYSTSIVRRYCQVPSDINGCTEYSACNYNSFANQDEGSCYYPDQGYDCYGNLVEPYCSDGLDNNNNNNGYFDSADAFCEPPTRDYTSCEILFGDFSFSLIKSQGECRGSCGESNVYVNSNTGKLPPVFDQGDGDGLSSLDLCGSTGLKCCIPEESEGYNLYEINLCLLGEPENYQGCLIEEIEYCTDGGDCFIGSEEDYGCTNPDADNYDPEADLDDNSCIYTTTCYGGDFIGYWDELEDYDSYGECLVECVEEWSSYIWILCLDESLDPYEVITLGCTDQNADNYNPDANINNGCSYTGSCSCYENYVLPVCGVTGGGPCGSGYDGCEDGYQANCLGDIYNEDGSLAGCGSCSPCVCEPLGDDEPKIPNYEGCSCWWDDTNPGGISACRPTNTECDSCAQLCGVYSVGGSFCGWECTDEEDCEQSCNSFYDPNCSSPDCNSGDNGDDYECIFNCNDGCNSILTGDCVSCDGIAAGTCFNDCGSRTP